MATILAVGQDEGLLSSRSAVLRKCNVEVITARPSEAREILVAQKFDLLVLCHTLSSDDMNDLVQLARQQTSDIQVLEVLRKTEFSWDRGPSGADGITASAPVTLVAKVTEMLSAHVRPC
jgi:DNA-binding response OmpR family regulator